jgi:NADH-quinone oxidoreductase subunit G
MLEYTDIIINDKFVKIKKGLTIIQACEEIGIQLPRFCYHEQLSIAGNCRMCLVEIDKSLKPIASCAITIDKGMKIYTNTALVKKAREGIMEFLLINHPLDCPICDQGGECDLQDQAMLFGNDRGRFYELKRTVSELDLGLFIKTVMTRCIHCTRCIRFLTELGGLNQLGTTGRGVKTEIGNYIEKNILSEVSGNIIDLCPVGALTSKPYAFTARPWELTKIETIDILDSMGSNIIYSLYGNKIMRILPLIHLGINEEWIDDKTRFSYDGFIIQRIIIPLYKNTNNSNFNKVSWNYILKILSRLLIDKVGIIINNDVSLETSYLLNLYNNNIKNINFYIENSIIKRDIDFRYSYLFNITYSGISNNDIFCIIGCNLKKELPLLLIKLRKEKRKKDIPIIVFASIENYYLNEFNIGYKTNNLIKFLEGKHYICSVFKKKKRPIVFLGSSILANININGYLYLFSKLKNLVNKFFNGLCCIEQGAGNNNLYEFGLNTTNKKINNNLYLNLNNYKIIFNKINKNNNIFLGSHGIENLYNYNIILPVTTNIEKNGLYINGEGRVQEMKLVQISNNNSKEDWRILLEIYDILFDNKNNNNLNNLMYLREKINNICYLNLNIVGYSSFYKIINKKYKINNLEILPYILNLYDNKVITKYSRLLVKYRQNIIKNNYN